MDWNLRRRDLWFMVDTLMPQTRDKEHAVDAIQDDQRFVEAMLEDDRIFERLMSGEEVLTQVSPWLLFAVLLRRARRDLRAESFTTERRRLQKVVIFDTADVIDLLEEDRLRAYLVATLVSFTRVESVTVAVRVGKNVWRRYRTNELDVDGLMRYSQALEEELRFEPYRRIGDVCLFLAGLFPNAIESEYRYPLSGQVRPRAQARACASLEDYEAHGQAFYRLASQHEMAGVQGLEDVLETLSERFILAEKALRFVSDRYLGLLRDQLFVA
ncbi:MAG: hypothetical protein PVJ55_02545 [Anaerolineae bacterium]|jgi:hypothetical protein